MYRRLIPALILIGLGSLFLLNNLGLTDLNIGRLFATGWPVLLILGGVHRLLHARGAAIRRC